MKKIVIAAVFALFSFTAIAQQPQVETPPASGVPNTSAIEGMRGEVGMSAVTVQAGIHYGDWSMTNNAATEGEKALDNDIGDAVKAAAGHSDLAAAVKAYYVASKAYFENAWSDPSTPAIVVQANEARLRADMDSKANAMMLEVKLAAQ